MQEAHYRLQELKKRMADDLANCECELMITDDEVRRLGLRYTRPKIDGVDYTVERSGFGTYKIKMRLDKVAFMNGGARDAAYENLLKALLDNDYETVANHIWMERKKREDAEEVLRLKREAELNAAIEARAKADENLRKLLDV